MPVGRFEYNPGVSDQRAQIFQNSNAMFGQALMGLLTSMGKAREQKQNKLDALTLDAKAADATFKADLAEAGQDPEAQKGVLSRYGVGSTEEFGHKSAVEKVATAQGVTASERNQRDLQQILRQRIEDKGSSMLPQLLTRASEMRDTPAGTDGSGQPAPRQPMSQVLMKALKTFNPDEQKALGQSSAFQSLIQKQLGGEMQDERTQQYITERGREADARLTVQKQRADTYQQLADDARKTHEENTKVAQDKLASLNQLRAQKGKVSPDTMWKGYQSTLKALYTARGTAVTMRVPPEQLATMDAQIKDSGGSAVAALVGGGTAAKPGAGTVPAYKSPDDVRAAYQSGKLTKAQAQTIISQQFPNFQSR